MRKSKSIQAVIRRARAQGRAEAVNIIARICPEDGIDGLIRSSANGESGDYSSYWDVDALRKLLRADAEVCDVIDRLQGAHEFTHYLKYDLNRAQSELALLKQTPAAATNLDALRFRFIAQHLLSALARQFAGDVSAELPEVLERLDSAISHAGYLPHTGSGNVAPTPLSDVEEPIS